MIAEETGTTTAEAVAAVTTETREGMAAETAATEIGERTDERAVEIVGETETCETGMTIEEIPAPCRAPVRHP